MRAGFEIHEQHYGRLAIVEPGPASLIVVARPSCKKRGRVPRPQSGVVRQSLPFALPWITRSSKAEQACRGAGLNSGARGLPP